jgi:hypothetical protein
LRIEEAGLFLYSFSAPPPFLQELAVLF